MNKNLLRRYYKIEVLFDGFYYKILASVKLIKLKYSDFNENNNMFKYKQII